MGCPHSSTLANHVYSKSLVYRGKHIVYASCQRFGTVYRAFSLNCSYLYPWIVSARLGENAARAKHFARGFEQLTGPATNSAAPVAMTYKRQLYYRRRL